jgi:hypothetical protein
MWKTPFPFRSVRCGIALLRFFERRGRHFGADLLVDIRGRNGIETTIGLLSSRNSPEMGNADEDPQTEG